MLETSGIIGFVSCIFLKAGLTVLEADQAPDAAMYGYYALAFIAGYNVDNFLKKLEAIAQDLWGIKKHALVRMIQKIKISFKTRGLQRHLFMYIKLGRTLGLLCT